MNQNPCTLNTFRTVFSSNAPPEQVMPNPILQVLQIKPIAAQPGTPERYRIVLSDSCNFIQAMLATQANPLVQNGEITKGCFVQLSQYQANKVKDRKILIVIDLQVMKQLGVKEKLGNPTTMEDDTASAPVQAQPPAAAASNFYGAPVQQAPQRPQQQQRQQHSGGGASTETVANVYPIVAVSPYQDKWTIKARVTYKSDIKNWSNQNNEGKLFTVHFLDETGEIRATGFNAECDNFYEVLQEGQVYYISKCRVNMAKKQFSNVDNDYELTLQRVTEIKPCADDSVPQMKFNFVPLADLDKVDKDGIIDVIGVVMAVGDINEINSKNTNKSYSKRDITIVDSSNAQVRCTIWGKTATGWEIPLETVVAFKGVKVSDFGGRSLSALFTSSITPNPDIDEAHGLKGWFDGQGQRDLNSFATHINTMGAATGRTDPIKNIQEVREENLGMGEKPDFFLLKAMIVYIKRENLAYPACGKETCNKKVNQRGDDLWYCESCSEGFAKPNYRYVLSVSVEDAFGQTWLSCFDDVGRMIMGISADELSQLKERSEFESDMEAKKQYDNAFTQAMCQTYLFKVKAKADTYNEVTRVRLQVMSAHPFNYAAEASKLAEQIKLYSL